MKFTDRSIKALKAREIRYEVSKDSGDGLGVRITPSGRKSFIFRFKRAGKNFGMTLGVYPEFSLADATLAHSEARSLLRRGINPAEKKLALKKSEMDAETVGGLIYLYIEEYAKKNKKSWKADESLLNNEVFPVLSERRVKDVTRREIKDILDKVANRAKVQANRLHSVIRKMFNFAIEEEIISSNPCALIKRPGGKEEAVDRCLSEKEIRLLWRRLNKTAISPLAKLVIKFQLVTGQRSGEVVQICKKDIVDGFWIIPKPKNNVQHRVPLSDLALKLLDHADRYRLFEKMKPADRIFPINAPSINRAISRNLTKIRVEHFTPHDLRRTAASMMASKGVPRLVISKILNHKDRDVTAIYDRHSYDAEKKAALDLWSQEMIKIVRIAKVN